MAQATPRRSARRGPAVALGVRVAPVRLSAADLLAYRPHEAPAAPAVTRWLLGAALVCAALAAQQPLLSAIGVGVALAGVLGPRARRKLPPTARQRIWSVRSRLPGRRRSSRR
jgi:hypothetical protein